MVPDPSDVIAEQWPVLACIREAVREGTRAARQYPDLAELEIGPDVWLSPNIVRLHAALSLQGTLPAGVQLELLANNGLLVHSGGFNIRILKTDEGDLPVPGSRSRRQFYEQLSLALPDDDDKLVNLVFLWDVDSGYELTELSLACPRTGGATRASVEDYWNYPLPLFGSVAPAEPTTETDAGEQDTGDAASSL